MRLLLPANYNPDALRTEVLLDAKEVEAPVSEGQKLGLARVYYGNELIDETDLLAIADVTRSEFSSVASTSTAYIPARIPQAVAEQVRESAVQVYTAIGCQGLSRVDFFVTYEDQQVVFNEINTLPGFTSISMYPKLFSESGIPYSQLLDKLLDLAMEASETCSR